jgi:diguanylate cyclase (GGDEF)-like protein/PAS domain S-box-containing protein
MVAIINGAILAFILQPYVSSSWIPLTWFVCLLVLTGGRVILVYGYHRLQPTPEQSNYWRYAYLIGAGLAGITWGSTAFFFFPVKSIAHQAFLAFVLAGMSSGAVAVLSARIEVCAFFLLPTLVPLAMQFFFQGKALHLAMGLMTLIYLFGMLGTAWTIHGLILKCLTLRFDKRDLLTEIAKRRHMEERLFQETERLQITLAAIGEGVIIIGADATLEYLNPAAEQLCGYSHRKAHRHPLRHLFSVLDEQTRQVTSMALEDCLQSGVPADKHMLLRTRDGQEYLIHEVAAPLRGRDGNISGAVAVFRDVTEARKLTSQLVYQANHDPLTHLPNRHLLKDRLHHAISCAQENCQSLAVLFLDLDHFKPVNDTLGHAAGDALLKAVVERLKGSVRKADTIARLGGDEFVIVLEALPDEKSAVAIAGKILATLASPFSLEGDRFSITGSIGIAFFPGDGEDAATLLKNADAAMYSAKTAGRNRIECFSSRKCASFLEDSQRMRKEQPEN